MPKDDCHRTENMRSVKTLDELAEKGNKSCLFDISQVGDTVNFWLVVQISLVLKRGQAAVSLYRPIFCQETHGSMVTVFVSDLSKAYDKMNHFASFVKLTNGGLGRFRSKC